MNVALARPDAGLFFIGFCRDPGTQYVPMQARTAREDALAEYVTHTASGLYAVPSGIRPGDSLGQPLPET
jgi:deferrochelatase/peroxidase EfeB